MSAGSTSFSNSDSPGRACQSTPTWSRPALPPTGASALVRSGHIPRVMEESPPEYLNLRDVDRRRNVVEFRFNV
jgi:hypothetical protein